MVHVVMADRGDHWHVVADYSKSPRHRAMSEAEWKREFSGPSYSKMRNSDKALVAAITPKGVGRWKKDWSGKARLAPDLALASSAPRDFDGVPCVESGKAHRITVSKASGDGANFRVLLSAPVPAFPYSFPLGGGLAEVTVGPSPHPCDVAVTVADVAGMVKSSTIKIRFK